MLEFDCIKPEDTGMASANLLNFARRLERENIPMHSIIVMRHGKICMETYYAPYTKDTLHRMFSVTKSFVSLAIGLLADKGVIRLDDRIVDYFPEKLPKGGAHPYLNILTIRQMLSMRTCYSVNAYKVIGADDWLGSFFTASPGHVPGTIFNYDTASTHTLCALVEKLTGMNLLDYLREQFLDELGFSGDAYILKDPSGLVSMGGSGLCATPRDVLKVIYTISQHGCIDGKQLLPADYLAEALEKHSDPYGRSSTLEEMQGYGYQIWMTTHNGYALFGMGGQLAAYYPDKDIILVTTADTQGRQGGVQCIYDAFYEEVYDKIDSNVCVGAADCNDYNELREFSKTRKLFVLPGDYASPLTESINGVWYEFDENPCGIRKLSLDFGVDRTTGRSAKNADGTICISGTTDGIKRGVLRYTNTTGEHEITFGLGDNVFQNFPDYNFKCGASAAFHVDNNLLIKIQIIDSDIGNIYISLGYIDDKISVMMRKLDEANFAEYNGVFSGKRIN